MDFTALGRSAHLTNSPRFLGHEASSHPEPQLIYVVNGVVNLVVDGMPIILRAHHAAWLPPYALHSRTMSDDAMTIGPLLEDNAIPPGGRVRVFSPVRSLTNLVTVILCAAPQNEAERVPFRKALGELLHDLTREQFPLVYPEHPVAYAVAVDAAAFDGTLADLAVRHFASVRHLQRLFLEETGLPFARWRTRARLNVALANLRAGASMREALGESGFATRDGLLKAVLRECGAPLDDVLSRFAEEDARGAA